MKKIIITLITVGLFTSVKSQFPVILSTNNPDNSGRIIKDTDGNFVVTGWLNDNGSNYFTPFLKKLTPSGSSVWSNSFGGNNSGSTNWVVKTSGGGFLVSAGHTRAYASPPYTSVSLYSASYIIKTDANGNQVWAKSLGGSSYGDNYGLKGVENSNGQFVFYGHVQNHSGCSSYATRMCKLDAQGNLTWSNCYQINPDVIAGFDKLANSNNYIAIHNLSNGLNIKKYDDNGNLISQVNYQYQGLLTKSSSITRCNSGGFFVVGSVSDNLPFLAKFDDNLNLVWAYTKQGVVKSWFTDVREYNSTIYTIGNIGNSNNNYRTVCIGAAFNSAGNLISDTLVQTPYTDIWLRSFEYDNGAFYVSGAIQQASTGYDAFITKFLAVLDCSSTTATITPQSSTTFCQGGSVILQASSSNSYSWSNGATSQSITATQSNTYSVTVTNANGCTATANQNVTVNLNPSVSFSLPNYTSINAASFTMNGNPSGGSYSGTGVSGNNFNPSNAGLGLKNLSYSYTDGNGCNGIANSSTIVFDTTGAICTTFDTVTTIVNDTNNVTIYDTITTTQTVYDTVTTYLSVNDTLKINVNLTGINPPQNFNTLSVYPNPANDHLLIDNGNLSSMNGYSIKITNALGQVVFNQPVTQQSFYIDLSIWGGNGTYFLYVIDPNQTIKEVKKIILQ